jgi:hypothetical protein
VYSVRRRLSAPAHGTQEARLLGGVLPAVSTFQRHSTQRPSVVFNAPILLLQEAPFSGVLRTGCSACGSDYPHQAPGLAGSPHVWPMYIARAWSWSWSLSRVACCVLVLVLVLEEQRQTGPQLAGTK